ncbi:sortase-associated OmpA-like protein PdsO [Colwelliaceae bacterium 6471]
MTFTLKNDTSSNSTGTKNSTLTLKMTSIVVIGALMGSPVWASNKPITTSVSDNNKMSTAEKREGVGFGVGAVVGAIFGGPAGAFITAIAGSFIAKNVNAEHDIKSLELALVEEKNSHQSAMEQFKQRLTQSEQAYQTELLALAQNYKSIGQLQVENLLMSLQFSTGSSEIAPHYLEQVNALAELLKASPTIQIDLSGYTDLQGDEQLNHAISLARVSSVKAALINLGIDEGRINTFAFGEKDPVVASAQQEVSFYDRRVVVKLHNQTNHMANNH